MKTKSVFVGDKTTVSFGNSLYEKGNNILVMHNHPRNSGFSVLDLEVFGSCDTLKTLTIVKNNGNVECLTKTNGFNLETFRREFIRMKKKTVVSGTNAEYEKFVRKLLLNSKSGIEWSEKDGE